MLYPIRNQYRDFIDLSGIWSFCLDPDDQGIRQSWFTTPPACGHIAVPGSWNEQIPGADQHFAPAWYFLNTVLPAGWKGRRWFIRIGSANYHATVWVNGRVLGSHEGGHLPFGFELPSRTEAGSPLLIAIRVENLPKPERVPPGEVKNAMNLLLGGHPNVSYDFFPYCGLHRPVLLEALPDSRIASLQVRTDIEAATGLVSIQIKVKGQARAGRVSILPPVGQGNTQPAPLAQGDLVFDGKTASARLTVADARFWCPDDPCLYQAQIRLEEDGRTVDEYTLDFGIRTIRVEGSRLLLNGQPIRLRGFGRHEDFAVSGRGQNLPVMIRDHELLKWTGANSFRTSHYPYSEEEMRLADRTGILIIDEIPAVGIGFGDPKKLRGPRLTQCKRQVNELIARDRNHPSVIAWCVSNEATPKGMLLSVVTGRPARGDRGGTNFLRTLLEQCRELDPDRPAVLVALLGAPREWLKMSDLVCLNRYYGWYTQPGRIAEGAQALAAELADLAELGKPILVTEFGADALGGSHAEPARMWTEEYQADYIAAMLDVLDACPAVVGTHVWNLADFRVTQSILRPNGCNYKGVFTRDRQPKQAAHLLRRRWKLTDS